MGLLRGFAAFFQGMAFIVATPRLWPRAMVPVVTALVLWAGLGALGAREAIHLAHHLMNGTLAADALAVLFAVPAVVIALALALALAQPLSGWALDGIVREQRGVLALPPLPEGAHHGAALSSLAGGLLAFAVGAPTIAALTLVGWLAPPALAVTVPAKVVVAALLVAWDLVDYPLALRGVRLRERVRWFGARFGSMLGFGLAAVVFFIVPGLGLFALPFGVAGAARLVR